MNQIARIGVVFLLSVLAAVGQTSPGWSEVHALAPGTDVRISLKSRAVRGRMAGATDDAVMVDSGKGPETFARADILQLSVKKKSHRRRNTLIGLGAGAAFGAIITAVGAQNCTGFCVRPISTGEAALGGAVLLGAIGAAVGAVIPTGGWRPIYRP